MKNMTNTQFFQVESGPQISAKDILEIVYKALSEKGYNPVNQIVVYIMSGDPTYITSLLPVGRDSCTNISRTPNKPDHWYAS